MVIYDGQTGQGCHVFFGLMGSNKCVCGKRGSRLCMYVCVYTRGRNGLLGSLFYLFWGIAFVFLFEWFELVCILFSCWLKKYPCCFRLCISCFLP